VSLFADASPNSRVKCDCRQKGIAVRKAIDSLIATYCIDHELLHTDRDFDPYEKHLGLLVVHP